MKHRPVPDWAEVVYEPLDANSHLLFLNSSLVGMALCGSYPATEWGWFGTGSWDEREVARQRPRCEACIAFSPKTPTRK